MPKNTSNSQRPSRWIIAFALLTLLSAGTLATAPSVGGDYISGDDVHLLRDHVLVNHPSIEHALHIFTIVHRDLYQPLHLLSFQIDFLLTGGDPHWMHVTNIAIHLVNALLVFLLIRQVTGKTLAAWVAALLFAVHPIAVESVAWLNGRTMLLSTGFVIAGLIAFDRWNTSPRRWGLLVAALFLFALTMMAKIRVELPALIILLLIVRRRRPDRTWWIGWGLATVIAAGFSAFAVKTTSVSEMVEKAARDMPGPPLARVFESLGWYFSHYVLPRGLSPWHPPRIVVTWTDPQVILGIVLVLGLIAIAALLWRRTRTPAVGLTWFFAAIFSTLQIVPTRAILAGERYAYLPIVGLHWIVGVAVAAVIAWALQHHRKTVRVGFGAAFAIAVAGCILVARRTTAYYADDLAKAHRIISVYPETEDVYKDLAWAYIRMGDYESARREAAKELDRPQSNQSAALQAIGWTFYEERNYAEAEKLLRKAVDADPEFSKAHYRLAETLVATARPQEAEIEFLKCLDITPTYLPALNDLALLYLNEGRREDAERVYRRILIEVNPYHVPAIYNLGDILLSRGEPAAAAEQYEQLLSWLGDDNYAKRAATNLGVCYVQLGRTGDAMAMYDRVLSRDPTFTEAALNKANLLMQLGRAKEAEATNRTLLSAVPNNEPALLALQEMLEVEARYGELIQLWEAAARTRGSAPNAWNWLAFDMAAAGRDRAAVDVALQYGRPADGSTIARATDVWMAAATGHIDDAESALSNMFADIQTVDPHAVTSLLAALENASRQDPQAAWPYYFVGLILVHQDRPDVARLVFEECRSRARSPEWRQRVERAASELPPAG